MEKSTQEIGKRLVEIVEELAFVERFLHARLAAMTSAVEQLRTGLGLTAQRPTQEVDALDLPFRKPLAVDAPIAIEHYRDFFAGWTMGAGTPVPNCSVRQLPAPDSALTYPGYRLVVSVHREGHHDCEFLSLEFDIRDRYFTGARHCESAIRLRSEPAVTVKPALRLFLDDGTWRDLWGEPFQVEDEFKSFASVIKIPPDAELRASPNGARLMYFLPSDVELTLDVAYVVQGFRHA